MVTLLPYARAILWMHDEVRIESLGFEWFFVATSLIGVPVPFSCWYVQRLQQRHFSDGIAAQSSFDNSLG